MNPLVRIASFLVVLAAVFGVAALAGAELDPSVDESPGEHEEGTEADMGAHAETTGSAETLLPGLAVAQDGYQLVPERTTTAPGEASPYRFRVVGPDGETVRDFDVEHERRMHLIVVRRDFQGFQHLHPRQLPDGSWEAKLRLADPGSYRVFADFATGGRSLTLAADLLAPGDFRPEPLPPVASEADAGDGYRVEIESAPPRAGGVTAVRFHVMRNGQEVDAVEPYLGADGHLVVLREGDQAFLHTHPEGEPGGPGPISFGVEYPSAGRYRLFLQFQHNGAVRTAAFTQVVRDNGGGANAEEAADGH